MTRTYTIYKAAEKFGIPHSTIRDMIRRGKIDAEQVVQKTKVWVIKEKDIKAYAKYRSIRAKQLG